MTRCRDPEISWWLDQAGRYPLLTPQQEVTLGRQVQAWVGDADPSPAVARRGRRARDRMVACNLRLVAVVARRYGHHAGAAVGLGDLIQGGNLGLIRAVEKFDPSRGYRFSTYAFFWVQQGVSQVVDRDSRTIRMPTTFAPRLATMGRTAQRLVGELGREPTRAELAQALGMELEELERVMAIGSRPASLDALVLSDGDTTRGEMLAAPERLPDDDLTLELRERLHLLEPRIQRLVRGRYGIDGRQVPLCRLGREEGLTVRQIKHLLALALKQLRAAQHLPPPKCERFVAGEQLNLLSAAPAAHAPSHGDAVQVAMSPAPLPGPASPPARRSAARPGRGSGRIHKAAAPTTQRSAAAQLAAWPVDA